VNFLLHSKDDLDAAGPLYREGLPMRCRFLDQAHPDVACSLNRLGNVLLVKGDYHAAEPPPHQTRAIGLNDGEPYAIRSEPTSSQT